jgi:hypothetical protein
MKLKLWWNKCFVWKNRIALTTWKIKVSNNHSGAQKLGEKTNSKQHLYKSKKKANINVEIQRRGQRCYVKRWWWWWWWRRRRQQRRRCDDNVLMMWYDVMWCDAPDKEVNRWTLYDVIFYLMFHKSTIKTISWI